MHEDKRAFRSKRVLVTGCCGTMGAETVKQLLSEDTGAAEVIGLDNNESALFAQGLAWAKDSRAHFFLCDIRDSRSIYERFANIDIILHNAALKHVGMCERAPMQAVESNIIGLQNVIRAAADRNVEKLIFTSSDKAVNPNSVMGISKLLGERLISAAHANRRGERTIFSSTRFGNVVGSNGSVFQIFLNQIAAGGPVTLTHKDMTRFIMSTREATALVLKSANLAKGGEVFVFRSMPKIRIADFAVAMIETFAPRFGYKARDIKITEIGSKSAEKLGEQLINEDEFDRASAFGDFLAIKPAFLGYFADTDYDYGTVRSVGSAEAMNSGTGPFLSVPEIVSKLHEWGLVSA